MIANDNTEVITQNTILNNTTGILTQYRSANHTTGVLTQYRNTNRTTGRGGLSYLAPLDSENISIPYFKQPFFRGGGYYPPRLSQTPRLPVPRQK